ncbi:hypothetical protein Tco_0573262 [Tanacetum coccineum]
MDELIEHVHQKTYAYADVRAKNQELLITISELKAKLKNVAKVRRALFTTPRSLKSSDTTSIVSKSRFSEKLAHSKFLATTPVVSKNKIEQGSSSNAKNMVSSAFKKSKGSLGHNLFSVGQLCDGDLKVAFRSKTCYVRNLEGDDLPTGVRESNLYIIFIFDMAGSSPIQNFPISLTEADEFNQEDFADFDGNTVFIPYNGPNHEEIESSTAALDPSNVQNFHQFINLPCGIFISHSQYTIELLKKHGLNECVSMSTPMATERLDVNLQGTLTDQTTYRRMIGGLMYLTASRPDISFATFVVLVNQSSPTLIAYSHADHAGCKDDCKSTFRGLQFLGEKLMRTQLLDCGYKYNRIPMYYDSKSPIAISCNPVQHSRTKHIDIRYHFIKEHVEKGIVELYFVGTEYQHADLFTKALPKERFEYLVHRIGMRCMTPTQLENLTKLSSWKDHISNM